MRRRVRGRGRGWCRRGRRRPHSRLRGEVPYGFGEFVDVLDVRGEVAGFGELLFEEDVRHGGEEQRVGAGPDRHMPVGEFGGAGASRVDDGQGAAAGSQGLELAGEVGGGAEAAVGFQGVGADEQEVVGVVQVRHGDRVGVAVEQSAGHVLGHLVDRGGGEDAAGAEGSEQDGRVEGAGHGVHVRVAEDDSDGVRSVPLGDRSQPRGHRVEGFLPGGFAQFAVLAYERGAQSVRVAVGGSEGGALRADEPLAEHVVTVAPGAGHPGALDRERQPAGGFAQGADAQGGAGVGGGAGGAGHGVLPEAVAALAHGLGPSIPTGRHAGEGSSGVRSEIRERVPERVPEAWVPVRPAPTAQSRIRSR